MRLLQAALVGDDAEVTTLSADLWSGAKWRGPHWTEAVSTAALGNWSAGLFRRRGHGISLSDVTKLREQARLTNLQLTPLWRRRSQLQRLHSLDFEFGDGMTAYDILSEGPDPFEVLYGALPDEPRINAVLQMLNPVERAVAFAYANPKTMPTWAEAASAVIAAHQALLRDQDPDSLGERVRRKLHRLGKRHTDRTRAAATSRQGRLK
ncbi:hypothetical protein [Streptomyces sp. SAS_275]|uniref:hypothetical protein n=1 Tax=Streptomyces sp. SAS_275 TaxID=3412746 RepID=UPI00403D01FF